MSKVKYIALDFDGTIYNDNHEISEDLVNMLIKLQEQDIKVILCSGRALSGVINTAEQIKLAQFGGFIICYNGGLVMAYDEQKNLYEIHRTNFSRREMIDLYSVLKDFDMTFASYANDKLCTYELTDQVLRSLNRTNMTHSFDVLDESPKIIMYSSFEDIALYREKLENAVFSVNQTANVFQSVSFLLEITPALANKGHGLKVLFDEFNFNPENLVAFGDAENDLTMFKYAKIGIAMGNACDELKGLATDITKTNNEDGVFHYLKNNLGDLI